MSLTFEEAATGVNTKIKIPPGILRRLQRHRSKSWHRRVACQTCAGRGQLAYQQGFFTITRTCPACQGAANRQRALHRMPRPGARREGTIIELRIPPGVDTGTRLRVQGEGEPGPMADQLAICTLSSM